MLFSAFGYIFYFQIWTKQINTMSPNSVVLNNGVKIHGESHNRPLRNRKISNRKYYYIALKLEDKKKRAVTFSVMPQVYGEMLSWWSRHNDVTFTSESEETLAALLYRWLNLSLCKQCFHKNFWLQKIIQWHSWMHSNHVTIILNLMLFTNTIKLYLIPFLNSVSSRII